MPARIEERIPDCGVIIAGSFSEIDRDFRPPEVHDMIPSLRVLGVDTH